MSTFADGQPSPHAHGWRYAPSPDDTGKRQAKYLAFQRASAPSLWFPAVVRPEQSYRDKKDASWVWGLDAVGAEGWRRRSSTGKWRRDADVRGIDEGEFERLRVDEAKLFWPAYRWKQEHLRPRLRASWGLTHLPLSPVLEETLHEVAMAYAERQIASLTTEEAARLRAGGAPFAGDESEAHDECDAAVESELVAWRRRWVQGCVQLGIDPKLRRQPSGGGQGVW
ncbi:hypothetical protein Q8F55_005980 [Vanrija albida]|uniref:Uncharacterized protein n=1 Tax=Vanrija albida TaxID=181172 RepID=A0ABR3Q345_9TREE